MRPRGRARQQLVIGVGAIVLFAAGGWATVVATRPDPPHAVPTTADDPGWRDKVDHAIPAVTPPAAVVAWHDGFHHYIIGGGGSATSAASAAVASGPDGRSGRWLRLSAPGRVADLSGPRGLAILPWIRAFVTDRSGATWAELVDNAPAGLGSATAGGADAQPADAVAALRALPHTTLSYIDGQRWAVRTTASLAQVKRVAGNAHITDDQLLALQGATDVSSDPYSDQQWYLQNRGDHYLAKPGDMIAGADADVPPSWAFTRGKGVTVAVIDSGMDISNPDLAGSLWTNPDEPCGSITDLDHDGFVGDCHGWDFTDGNATGQLHPTRSPHGTAVAGIIAATGGNGIGMTGIAPDAEIMPLDVSVGGIYLSESGLEAAMQYAIDHHADIINLSLGGLGRIPPGLQNELDRAQAAGILVVAAAGNWGMNLDTSADYPANASVTNTNVLTVGWSNPDDTPNSVSDYSPTRVQVFAPGTALLTTSLASSNGGFALFSGTSAAAPVVAGEAALLEALNPGLTPAQVIDTIESTSDQIAAFNGYDAAGGRVDVSAAVRSVASSATDIHYAFDGFDALTGSTQNTNVQVKADPSAIPAGDQCSLSLTLATRISGQTMVVTNYPVNVTAPDGSQSTVTTDGSGTATVTGVSAASLGGSGGTFALTTGLPDGLYALAAQLDDVTSGVTVGSVGRVVFDIDGSLVPAPSTTIASTTTVPATSTTGATTTTAAPTSTTVASTTTSAVATTTTTTTASPTTTAATTTTAPLAPTTTLASTTTSVPSSTTTTATAPTSTTIPPVTSSTGTTTTTTVPLPPPPDPPTGLGATPGDGTVTLAWSATSGGVNGYRVYDDDGLVAQTTALGITVTGLQNGQTYNYAVSAYTIYGESARTAPVAVTPATPTTTAAPSSTTSAPAVSTTSTTPPTTTTTTIPSSPYHVSPSNGPVGGGTSISITGPDMPDGIGIFIGGAAATDVQHVSAGVYTATTGANVIPGTYDVQLIENSGAIIEIPSAFTYESGPTTSTTPTSAPPSTSPPTTSPSSTTTPATSPASTSPPATTAPAPTTPVTAPPSNGLDLSAAPPGGVLSDFPPGLWDGAICRSPSC